jgi:AraC-like DNA-binding protein
MNSRLSCFNDWEASARLAHYQASALADHYRISLRQLERYCIKRFGTSVHAWLNVVRLQDSNEGLMRGDLIKVVALEVCFCNSSNFCRWYKRMTGSNPSEIRFRLNTAPDVVFG